MLHSAHSTHTHTRTHARTHTHTHTHTHAHTHTHPDTHACAHARTYIETQDVCVLQYDTQAPAHTHYIWRWGDSKLSTHTPLADPQQRMHLCNGCTCACHCSDRAAAAVATHHTHSQCHRAASQAAGGPSSVRVPLDTGSACAVRSTHYVRVFPAWKDDWHRLALRSSQWANHGKQECFGLQMACRCVLPTHQSIMCALHHACIVVITHITQCRQRKAAVCSQPHSATRGGSLQLAQYILSSASAAPASGQVRPLLS